MRVRCRQRKDGEERPASTSFQRKKISHWGLYLNRTRERSSNLGLRSNPRHSCMVTVHLILPHFPPLPSNPALPASHSCLSSTGKGLIWLTEQHRGSRRGPDWKRIKQLSDCHPSLHRAFPLPRLAAARSDCIEVHFGLRPVDTVSWKPEVIWDAWKQTRLNTAHTHQRVRGRYAPRVFWRQ